MSQNEQSQNEQKNQTPADIYVQEVKAGRKSLERQTAWEKMLEQAEAKAKATDNLIKKELK